MSNLLPEGVYVANPIACGIVEFKDNARFRIEFSVTHNGETHYLDKTGDMDGAYVKHTVANAELCGCDVDGSEPMDWKVDPKKKVRITVEHYNGNAYVKYVNPDLGPGDRVKVFAAKKDVAAAASAAMRERIRELRNPSSVGSVLDPEDDLKF